MTRERGQLVLVAAAVVAVALVPMLLAALQVGHQPAASTDRATDPAAGAVQYLDRTTHNTSVTVAGEFNWSDRDRAASRSTDLVGDDIAVLESTVPAQSVAYEVTLDGDAAREWVDGRCPSSPHRQFGPCEVHGGLVLQERAGETHLLAAAYRVTVHADRGTTRLTVVSRALGRPEAEWRRPDGRRQRGSAAGPRDRPRVPGIRLLLAWS